jgi:hypothetical protein
MRVKFDNRLELGTVVRGKVTKADGTVEDLGVLSASINPKSLKQWYKLLQNIRRFGWHRSQ